jgi:hypothetical protein
MSMILWFVEGLWGERGDKSRITKVERRQQLSILGFLLYCLLFSAQLLCFLPLQK